MTNPVESTLGSSRDRNPGNRTKPDLPLWAVSRLGGLAKGCSFYLARFPGVQTRPFRRNGADRFVPRVRVAGCVRSHESRVQVKSTVISWATERSPDRWDRGAADLPRDGADDGGLDRGGAGDVASSARTGPVYAHVHMHPGAWAKTERAGLRAPGERSRERPLLVLLVLWLARTSMPRRQLHRSNEPSVDPACWQSPILHYFQPPERARYAIRPQGYANRRKFCTLEARARPNFANERRATHQPRIRTAHR